ncbi:hypothetical protein Pelo_19419 [Pelomyxa schiedti]|nr:hypothetical protein Pelo_19419 [Pelomyxa schiedti]
MQSDSGSYYVVVTSTVPLNASTSGADTSSDGDGYYVIGRSNTILVGIHGTPAHKLVPLTNYYSDGVVYSTTTNMYSVVQEPPMFVLEDSGGAQHSVNTSFLEGYALRADDMASANLYLLDDRELYDGNYSGLLNWILFGSDATGYVFGFTMVDTCTELDPVQVIDSTSYFMPIAITLLLGSAILLLGVISWIMHVCIMRVHLRGQRDAYPGIRDNFTYHS